MIGIDFFGVKDTGKSLLILIKVHGGVVLIKGEPFPLAEDGELLRLETFFEFEQAEPVHRIKSSTNYDG